MGMFFSLWHFAYGSREYLEAMAMFLSVRHVTCLRQVVPYLRFTKLTTRACI